MPVSGRQIGRMNKHGDIAGSFLILRRQWYSITSESSNGSAKVPQDSPAFRMRKPQNALLHFLERQFLLQRFFENVATLPQTKRRSQGSDIVKESSKIVSSTPFARSSCANPCATLAVPRACRQNTSFASVPLDWQTSSGGCRKARSRMRHKPRA